MKTSASPVIGIDVASDELVLCDGKISKLANTAEAVRRFLRRVPSPVLLVCEATGGYERILVAQAHGLGLSIHVANPRRVRDFARSLGRLEKTDPVDAEVIRRYGEALRPPRQRNRRKRSCVNSSTCGTTSVKRTRAGQTDWRRPPR